MSYTFILYFFIKLPTTCGNTGFGKTYGRFTYAFQRTNTQA